MHIFCIEVFAFVKYTDVACDFSYMVLSYILVFSVLLTVLSNKFLRPTIFDQNLVWLLARLFL